MFPVSYTHLEETEYDKIPYSEVESPEHLALSRKAAEESFVLLKNNGILPLQKEKIKTIGIVGPNADSRAALVGNYHGTASRYCTIQEGIQDYLGAGGSDVRVLASVGCDLFRDRTEHLALTQDRLAEAKIVAANSDVEMCIRDRRNIVRIYPYDVAPNVDTTGDGVADEGSLRGSSEIVAGRIRDEIQQKVADAGLEIIEARITYLAYAPEIAAVMLQRQQASAIIDARKMIVDGAVGMVEMALERLNENNVVELDEERKAAMVSNLLVVLCGNHDAQPVVNSGSLY